MDENKTNKRDNKKFVDTMTRKTHFTELEIERLLELHHKTMVSLEYVMKHVIVAQCSTKQTPMPHLNATFY